MKLAEAKRRIEVGMVIEATGHYNPNASGPRTVTKVQGNGFWFSSPNLKRGWCPWPPAKLAESKGPDAITLLMVGDGRPMTTLVFPSKGNES